MNSHRLQPMELREIPRVRLWLLFGLAFSCGVVAVQWMRVLLDLQPAGVDYLPVWTAARLASENPAAVYDFKAVTESQRWLIGWGWDLRPFVYPPPFLLLLAPFAALGFWISYVLWVAATGGLYLWSATRMFPSWRGVSLFFLVTSPPFVVATLTGQPTLLIAALLFLSLSMLEARPVLAGVLIGVSVCAKPSLMALAPLCLLAGGHQRALASAVIAGVALVLASLAAYGLDTWLHWVSSLGDFQTLVKENPFLLRSVITPTGAALQLGLDGPALAVLRAAFAIASGVIVWVGFRKPRSFEHRVTALVASGLLVSPYAMQYDAVMLVPAAITMLLRTVAGPRWLLGCAALVLVVCAGRAYVAPYAALALIALLLWFEYSRGSVERENGPGNAASASAPGLQSY